LFFFFNFVWKFFFYELDNFQIINTVSFLILLQKLSVFVYSIKAVFSPTFGTNTRQRVPVVQKMMKIEMMIKEAFCSSFKTKLTATPSTHMMATLYTDMPTYLGKK